MKTKNNFYLVEQKMKLHSSILIFAYQILICGSCDHKSKVSSEKVTIKEVNSYIGKPIYTLVDRLVKDGPENSILIEEPTGYLVGARVRRVESRQVISIYIQHPGVVEPSDTLRNWILEEVYQEIIDTVTIYNLD